MIKIILIAFSVLIITQAAIPADKMSMVPGYQVTFQPSVYSGYLNTSSTDRKLHYVFIQSANKANNSDPVTLWLNGGPGCSSLLGFLQQIGPYYLQQGVHYKVGDSLTPNPHSWHKISNLLFLQSPPGVGYSINRDANYQYNDYNTLMDNFDALLNFFKSYPQYVNNPFWIAGQSYAGKYIPDLAVFIDSYNERTGVTKINMKGVLIGNGVMNFRDDQLQKSQTQFVIDHQFVDPELISYYTRSCFTDQKSAGCQYFKTRFDDNVAQINPYSVYDYCYYNDSFVAPGKQNKKYHSQQSILKILASQQQINSKNLNNYNGAPCAYFDGMYQYFNAHVKNFHAQQNMTWNGPCAQKISQKYTIDRSGSMYQFLHLLGQGNKYHIVLYSGDWDGVVPYVDTLKNIQKLNLKQSYVYAPWFVNQQHAGFIQLYNGLTFIIVKGASHQVPQSKRAQSFDMFQSIIKSHGSQQQFKKIILTK